MPQKKSSIDKLIKGIIIGGAIGSVVGVALAPKSGKETRSDIKNRATSLFQPKKKALPGSNPVKQTRRGPLRTLLRGLRTLFFGRKKS